MARELECTDKNKNSLTKFYLQKQSPIKLQIKKQLLYVCTVSKNVRRGQVTYSTAVV